MEISEDILSFWILLFAGLFLTGWVLQLIFSLSVYLRTWLRGRAEAKGRVAYADDAPGVSVVIYTHNQADLLLHNLPALLESDYPEYEIIVVDDASTDDTRDVLTMMEQRSDRFYHTRISDDVRTLSRHKLAILLGIKAARHEIILETQAQCVPASRRWIGMMARNFTPSTDLVLGPVCYEDRTGFMSRFYAFDLFHRMLWLFGVTLSAFPYAGCGMNLAFRKKVFFEHGGFNKHLAIHPGEDDLFVADMSRRGNTKVECSADAVVVSQERPLHYGWSQLRLNRAFTSRYYAFLPRLMKGTEVLSRYLLFFAGVALLCVLWGHWLWFGIAIALWVLHCVVRTTIYHATAKLLQMHRFLFSVFFELLLPLVDLYFQIKALLRSRSFIVGRI